MSSELDVKFPEIFYDDTKGYMYKYLKDDPESPFNGQTHAAIFIFAMALAKREGLLPADVKKPSKMQPGAFNSAMRTLMRSIMMEEKRDVYCIKDNIELRNMCQKYANAGIDKLYLRFFKRQAWEDKEKVLADLIKLQT